MEQTNDTDRPIRVKVSGPQTAKFLPQLPQKRGKPIWSTTAPSFVLNGDPPKDIIGRDKYDIFTEVSSKRKSIPPINDKKAKQQRRSQTGHGGDIASSSANAKKAREDFRAALVNIIMHDEDGRTTPASLEIGGPTGTPGAPTSAEKDILRYYYYIHNGIDTSHVAPMDDTWIQNILRMIPQRLKVLIHLIDSMTEEIRGDYLLSVKKAIVDFVLRDPRDKGVSKGKLPTHRAELMVVPKPWEKSFYWAYHQMQQKLNITSPTMLNVLNLWQTSFTGLRLIDVNEFHERKDSMQLSFFQTLIVRHMEAAKEKLLKKWFPEIQNIYYQGNKRKQVPSNHNETKLRSFFNCAAALMTDQLKNLCINSIKDYTDLICQPPDSVRAQEHSGFVLNLVLDDTKLRFEPDFEDFKMVLLNVFDALVKAVGIIPRVETKLYSEWVSC